MNLSQIAAVSFFVLLVSGLLTAIGVVVRRSRLSPLQCVFLFLAYLVCKFLWRARWLNEAPLRAGQGAIIVCNHRSSVDPFFIQTATCRKIHWLVAREYCAHPAFRWFLSFCEVIPVGRGGVDTAATKAAIRLAASGEIVGMLPEGRINMSEDFMLPARPGAALVALKAGVPIVPCYISGSPYRRYTWSPLLMPARVEVRFGQPLETSQWLGRETESGLAQELTRQALKAIAALAGHSDFEPRIAGRNWKPTEAELVAAIAAKEQREGG